MPNTPYVRLNRRLWLAKITIVREKHVGERKNLAVKAAHSLSKAAVGKIK